MTRLLLISLAPVLIIAIYVYIRDRYEKEPLSLLLRALFFGALITYPIILAETYLTRIKPEFSTQIQSVFYDSFVIAGFTEEFFKFFILFLLIWRNRNFSERFDGIVYAVFISLGFAAVENLIYVFSHGSEVGYFRAVTSVPAHAVFGISMGFYFAQARFKRSNRLIMLFKAILFPVLLHGLFDFILLLNSPYLLLIVFLPFLIFLYFDGFRKMKKLSR